MGALFAVLLSTGCAGCGHGAQSGEKADAGATPFTADPQAVRARAAALLDAGATLPDRAELVALTDAVAIAAQRAGRTAVSSNPARPGDPPNPPAQPVAADLTMLAADLRARLWRHDQAQSDAREALELYGAAALAAATPEQGCEAERRRALLAGELSRDAAITYRELYLASRRQEGRAAAATPVKMGGDPPYPPAQPAASRCRAAIDMALAAAVAYRPAGDAMRALEHDGDLAADAMRRGEMTATVASAGGAPAPPGSAEAPPAMSAGPAGDVVLSPREEAVGKEPVKIVGVEPWSGQDAARVVVRLSGPATFQVGTADSKGGEPDPRVYVDIARAHAKGIPHEILSTGLVHRIRLGAHASGTRVVLDLSTPPAARRVFYLPDPFRIVIDVGTRKQPEPASPSAPGTPREVRRIAVDPGHGGNDSGATGPTGLKEKDVTLDIAHRVAPLLAHELGVETLLTRDNDTYVPLDLRAARANSFHADLFVSIHCNASENGAAHGVQTFILDEARDPDGVAARVAARENAQHGGSNDPGAITALLTRLNPAEMGARSRHVADLLQRSALASLAPRYPDTKDQGVKTAGFFVLVGAEMPAVLFETAFISNTEEEGRLATADYRQKFADAILNAVRAYKAGK